MQKVVLELNIHDDSNCKQKAIKLVSCVLGVDSISMDVKEKKLTVTGDMDPVELVKTLRKKYNSTKIVSVGPAKEPEKRKEEPKKPKEVPKPVVQVPYHVIQAHTYYPSCYYSPCYYT